jgi:SPP1 gp7 family putative phage head morphogenesis protein
MRLFGLNITRTKAPALLTNVQLKPNDGQGPYTSYFNFLPRKVESTFYEFLREAIPIIDAAIGRLTSLDGHIVVKGNNEALVEEIQEWFYNVPVNSVQKGVQAFHQSFTSEAFEQGFALGEFIANKKRTDIVELRTADSKYIKFKRNASGGLDIFQKSDADLTERQLNSENLFYFSINNENQNPYGTPLMRSCEFVAKILITMQNSLLNVWERFGDPAYHVHYTAALSGMSTNLEERRKKIETDFNAVITAKRAGKSGDLVTAGGKDSSVVIKVIGADGQTLEFEVPGRHVQEQLIAKTGMPAWMLGMHWSTTERLSDAEAEMLLGDVATRQAAKMPLFYNLVRNLLLLRGRTWKKGDWWLEWAQVNLRDILKQAQARFMNAQADMYYLQNAGAAGIEIDINQLAIGKAAKDRKEVKGKKKPPQLPLAKGENKLLQLPFAKEENKLLQLPFTKGENKRGSCFYSKEPSRPTPWPELDKVETEYENELKFEWNELKEKVFTILKLNDIKSNPSQPPLKLRGGEGGVISKEDVPGLDEFNFSEEQRAMILQSFKDWIGTFDIEDADSPVTWYYGLAYSLGLIQAAQMIGKDQPLLDILKNKEIFDELCKNGFQLVKDNATKAIVNEILPAIDAHVIAGSNPNQIAAILEKLFEGKNSDWERLVRTEITSAAERAKLDEWGAWGIKKVRFVPAPDACPICISLAGEYDIDKCPVPGTGTHPRCRCSIVPVDEERP